MTKLESANALSAALTSTSKWRLNNAEKYPADKRYERAARKLAKLADESKSLSDESWRLLEPHFNSARWHEALREVSRQIGFHRKMSLRFFVRSLARLLSATPASAA